jgi:LCP family protein required for cell wall assembly
MTLELERPLRYPDTGSAPLMDKRARWLVVLGFVLPGSAQLLAGSRKLGRFGLGATITLLAIGLLALAGLLLARGFTLSVLTHSVVLLVLQVLILAYAVLWLVLGLDTLRLTRLVSISPNWRVPVAVLSILLTVLPVGAAAWAATTVGAARGAIGDIFANKAPSVLPVDGRYNILLLGVDPGADREGMRPDSISLVSVDAETGQSIIVGLPRELTEMPFPETSPMYEVHPNGFCMGPNAFGDYGGCLTTGYLNAIYSEVEVVNDPQYGYLYEGMYADAVSRGSSPGIEAMKDAVTGATGLTVQFYVLIDMDGFASLIDALGGVTIDVQQPIPIGGYEDPETGEWVPGDAYIEPGVQTMNGELALLFARVRHGLPNGDYDRMEHQRQLQAAILAQMSPTNVLLRFQEIAGTGAAIVRTDIPESMLGSFVDLAAKAKEFAPLVVQLTPPEIDPEYPDYALIHRMVADAVLATSPVVEEE